MEEDEREQEPEQEHFLQDKEQEDYILDLFDLEPSPMNLCAGDQPRETPQKDEDNYVEKRKQKTERLKIQYREELEEHMNTGRDWVCHYLLEGDQKFKKPKAQYTTTKYAAEPIEGERGYELFENRTDTEPLRKKYMSYHLMWTD